MNPELRELTTFKLGGPCDEFTSCETPNEVIEAFQQPTKKPRMVLGEGSNILCADAGFDGHIIRFIDRQTAPLPERNGLTVSGGMLLEDLCRWTCENGYAGLAYCSGIPGTVGGALAGNAGAFGHSLSESLTSATLLSPDGQVRTSTPGDFDFQYRHSRLKETGDLVLRAHFALDPGDPEVLLREREEILSYRRERHPDYRNIPCAGSFFRNISPSSRAEKRQAAGWFLDQIGARAQSFGGAAVFSGHANILINRGPDTRSTDVIHLASLLKRAVYQRFSIRLHPEVRLIGFGRTGKSSFFS